MTCTGFTTLCQEILIVQTRLAWFSQLLDESNDRDGLASITKNLRLCQEPSTRSLLENLIGALQQASMTMAELNYPYAVDFAGYSLPGNPCKLACSKFSSSGSLLAGLSQAASVVPQLAPAGCLNTSALPSFESSLPGLLPGAWTFQRCSDIVIPYEVGPE